MSPSVRAWALSAAIRSHVGLAGGERLLERGDLDRTLLGARGAGEPALELGLRVRGLCEPLLELGLALLPHRLALLDLLQPSAESARL